MNQKKLTHKEALKVLLIDDSDVDNFINKTIISKEECVSEITVMNSGREALDYLNGILDKPEYYPDIIFLDIRMPQMNGFEFLEEYINLPITLIDTCKIYILSSSIDPLDSEKGKNYTVVTGHLSKPLAHHNINNLLFKE